MKYEAKLKLWGKEYDVAVINGERFIDGKTVEEFMKTLTPDELTKSAIIGIEALRDERKGLKVKRLVKMAENLTDEDVKNFDPIKEIKSLSEL